MPVLPRQRQIPRRLDEGSSEHVFSFVEAYFRKDYFEALDSVKGELEKRFRQENFMFIRTIECILIDSANGKNVSVPTKVKSLYKDDIDMEELSLHLT